MKAFPTAADNGHLQNQDGMDLRDYFAAKAMQYFLYECLHGDLDLDKVAFFSYAAAEAMISRKEK